MPRQIIAIGHHKVLNKVSMESLIYSEIRIICMRNKIPEIVSLLLSAPPFLAFLLGIIYFLFFFLSSLGGLLEFYAKYLMVAFPIAGLAVGILVYFRSSESCWLSISAVHVGLLGTFSGVFVRIVLMDNYISTPWVYIVAGISLCGLILLWAASLYLNRKFPNTWSAAGPMILSAIIAFAALCALFLMVKFLPHNTYSSSYERCEMQQGFYCKDYRLVDSSTGTDTLMFTFQNGRGTGMIITSISVQGTGDLADVQCANYSLASLNWAGKPGLHIENGMSESVILNCGNRFDGLAGSGRKKFDINVTWYAADSTADFSHNMAGQLLAGIETQ
jgi:hypothetical protein